MIYEIIIRPTLNKGLTSPPHTVPHKKKKYKDLCEANNWDLAPLVFSSFGHPTSQTVKWLRTFASISKTPGTFRKLMHVCSIAVVRGNHDIISLLTTAPKSPSHPA
jgi:hypothetical protein